jgi:hypothetical protein
LDYPPKRRPSRLCRFQRCAILSKSIAYGVMNGPNDFTITSVIKDCERRPDLGRITLPTLITRGHSATEAPNPHPAHKRTQRDK